MAATEGSGTRGKIKAISVSNRRGTKKDNVSWADLRVDHGIIGDAHAGSWHRQVSLLAFESIVKMVAGGARALPGDFAENITTEGIDLLRLSVGSRLRLGEAVELEIMQLGKRCHRKCEIFERVGDCVMPREGVFAKVTKPGRINIEDVIEVIND